MQLQHRLRIATSSALLLSLACSSPVSQSVSAGTDEVSGPVTMDFDHPQPPGKSGDLLGKFEAIDFGSHWRWRSAIGGDSTNSIELASSSAASGAFAFIHGSRYMQSVKAFTHDGSKGRLTASDDRGQSSSITLDGTLKTLSFGWTKPSSTVTFSFAASVGTGAPIGLDDPTWIVPLTITTPSLANAYVGQSYSASLEANGGVSPYAWSIVSGALPSGLQLSGAGLLSGTLTAPGSFTFTAEVDDSGSPHEKADKSYTVQVEAQLSITTSSLPSGVVGQKYSAQLQASGGTPPLSWSILAGMLPAGLALDPASGLISGTPTAPGTSSFTAQVSDALQDATQGLAITIEAPLQITNTRLNDGMQGVLYAPDVLVATGGGGQLTWRATGLPPGLGLSANTIAGTVTPGQLPIPGEPFTYTVHITVQDALQQASVDLGLVVSPADFFIATGGSDTNNGLYAQASGGNNGPFATVGGAQTAISGIVGGRSTPILVYLRGGTFYTSQTIAPTTSGSASAPIVYQSFAGESAVLSGGMRVTGWTRSAGNMWRATLPAGTQRFEDLFYNDVRRLRPRVGSAPNLNVGAFLRVHGEYYSPTQSAACSLFVSGLGYKCFDRFYYDPNDPISSQWKNLQPPTGNLCGAPPGNPSLVGDIELDLFEAWTMEQMRISCIDTVGHVIYLTAPMRAPSIDQINFRGPVLGHRYVIENVQDLLLQPGQWFLDRTSMTLSYLAQAGEDPNQDTVIVPQAQPLMLLQLVSWIQLKNLTLEIDNYYPGPSGFGDDDNGENNLPGAVDCESCQNVLFDGVVVRETSASGIKIDHLLGNGSPAANVTIQNSAFYDLGDSGIHIGHSPVGSDTDQTMPYAITVQNNIIQGYSRVFADGEGISTGSMHDSTFSHNDITDGYHAGISVCSIGCSAAKTSAGTSSVVSEYNHIWNVMQGITADGGTLYYNVGNATRSGLGNKIRHNKIHDVTDSSIIDQGVHGSGYGGAGIYLDIQSGDVDVAYNVVYRVSASSFYEGEGPAPGQPPNHVRNNIFAYARQSMTFEYEKQPDACNAPNLRMNMIGNIFYFDRDDRSSPSFYVETGCAYACGQAYDRFQNLQGNLYWRRDGLFGSYGKQFHVATAEAGCTNPSQWDFLTFAQWQGTPIIHGIPVPMLEDVSPAGLIADPNFGNPVYPADDFTLAASPIPAFDAVQTNDTIANAGRNNPVLQPPVVPATFPIYQFNPVTDF
jgi:hypothetical protein